MAVQYHNGIGVNSTSGRLYFSQGVTTYGSQDAAMYKTPDSINTDFTSSEWAPWGSNNLLPLEMINHMDNCGVLETAMNIKERLSMGKGLQPFYKTGIVDGEEVLEFANIPEILDWLEYSNLFTQGSLLSYDRNAFGWSCGSLVFNKGNTQINRIRRIDVSTARINRRTPTLKYCNKLFLCEDWEQAPSTLDNKKVVAIDMLRQGYEWDDLSVFTKSEVAFSMRHLKRSKNYYPYPLWWSAREWVKVVRSIPGIKNAMFNNLIGVHAIIQISEKYWELRHEDWDNYDDKKKEAVIAEKYEEIDKWLTGVENQYKTLSSGCYIDPITQKETPFITITILDDKIKDGKLLPDSSAGNSEILFAALVSPAMIGVGQPGGPYANNAGGSNIRESHSQQIMILEPERKDIQFLMNLVSRFNKWDKTYAKEGAQLVFRFPAGLLTTLDTGKGTKSQSN